MDLCAAGETVIAVRTCYGYSKTSARRVAAGELNLPLKEAENRLERIGMPRTRLYLRGRGYRYDERSRRWGVPMERDVSVEVEQG